MISFKQYSLDSGITTAWGEIIEAESFITSSGIVIRLEVNGSAADLTVGETYNLALMLLQIHKDSVTKMKL